MRYNCVEPYHLVYRTSNGATKTLQELIQAERTHEASFRAWNHQSLTVNRAISSWVLADSGDDQIIDVLNQISRLLTHSVHAQNQYAIALADYRASLKEIMIRDSNLRLIKRQREILLKRLLKLNKQASIISPVNSLRLQIKLDDAKREVSVCQKNLKSASDALFNAKQFALREALRLKLSKFEQLGQTIKLDASQAIQLLTQLDLTEPNSSADEFDFESCDEDPTLHDTYHHPQQQTDPPTPEPPSTHESPHPSQPTENQPTVARPNTPIQAANETTRVAKHETRAAKNETRAAKNETQAAKHETRAAKNETRPHHRQTQKPTAKPRQPRGPSGGGTIKRPSTKGIVKKRASFSSRRNQVSPPPHSKRFTLSAQPNRTNRVSQPQHARKRSQSLNLEPSMASRQLHPANTRTPLARPSSHSNLSRSNPLNTSNPVLPPNLGSLRGSSGHKTRDSLLSFKFFSKGMLSRLGGKGKRKEDPSQVDPYKPQWSHSSQSPQNLAGGIGPTGREDSSLWPTIHPVSLNSYSEEEGSEEDSLSSQGDDELETAEVADQVSGLGRAGPIGPPHGGTSPEGNGRPGAPHHRSWGTPSTHPGARRRRTRPTGPPIRPSDAESSGSEANTPYGHSLTDYLPPDELAIRRRRQVEHHKAVLALTRNFDKIQLDRSLAAAAAASISRARRDLPIRPDRSHLNNTSEDKENRPTTLEDHFVQYDSDIHFSENVDDEEEEQAIPSARRREWPEGQKTRLEEEGLEQEGPKDHTHTDRLERRHALDLGSDTEFVEATQKAMGDIKTRFTLLGMNS